MPTGPTVIFSIQISTFHKRFLFKSEIVYESQHAKAIFHFEIILFKNTT